MDPRGKEKESNQRTAPDIPLSGARREKRSQKIPASLGSLSVSWVQRGSFPCLPRRGAACADDGGVGVGGARRRRRKRGWRGSLRRSCAQLLRGTGRFSFLAARVPPLRTSAMPLRPHGSSAHTRREETERHRKGRAGTDRYCGPCKRVDVCVFFSKEK
jgi:hypothetical protein